MPRGDLVQYFFAGDPHPDHPLIKTELLYDPPPHFAEPRRFDGVMVDDLLSIAVNKVTIHTRYEPKDYVDLYMIVRSGEYRLDDLIQMAKEKMVGLDEPTIATHFSKAEELTHFDEFLRAYMRVPIDLTELRRWYRQQARRLSEIVPPPRPA